MTKKILCLLGILITIILGTWLYLRCCSKCATEGVQDDAVIESDGSVVTADEPEKSAAFYQFGFAGAGMDYHTSDNFMFLKTGFKHLDPLSDSINIGMGKLKTFLAENPNQKLRITGYAQQSEKNTSSFPNLGYARANNVKNYFISQGIPASKLQAKGELVGLLQTDQDTVLGAVDYALFEADPEKNALAMEALKVTINEAPLTLHFKTNQTQIELSTAQRQKMADIVRYMGNVPGAQLIVVGHTDNTGNRENNIRLGQKRAEFIKSYLVSLGIANEQVISTSKGPDEPIADNSTEEGRAQNRRTAVSIK